MSVDGAPPVTPEQLFLQHLQVIDRIIGVIARRHALSVSDADEFAAWARARLMDHDYAIIRKFGGRSTMSTYLSVVLSNLFRDHRNSVWGRWRPSALALRQGPLAIRLEELMSRDGCSLREAIAILRSAGVEEGDATLARLASTLPRRTNEREVSIDALAEGIPDPAEPTPLAAEERKRFVAALNAALAQLTAEERLVLRMRYWDQMSVADIARALRLEQKPLYRKLDALLRTLRERLRREGIDDDRARDLLSGDGLW